MNLEFKGIEYNFDKFEDDSIYIFSNFNEYKYYENIDRNIFKKYKLISEGEFWEKYILSNYGILKEEKETIFFYKALSIEDKKYFNISSYFDCIDISYRYYAFMDEYYKYRIDLSKIKIFSWQRELINKYLDINDKMIELAKINKKIPRYLLNYFSYKNIKLLDEYKKIYFVNKFHFTEVEKEYLKGIKFTNILMVDESDYSLNDNYLKSIKLKKIDNSKIVVIKSKSSFSQLLNVLNINDFDRIYDFDAKLNDLEYSFLNRNLINIDKEIYLNSSKIYTILNRILDVYTNKETLNNKTHYLISTVFSLFNIEIFREIFNIDIDVLEKLIILNNNKKYVSSNDLIEINNLDKILEISSKEDFLKLFDKLLIKIDKTDKFFNIRASIYEAISELNLNDTDVLNDFFKDYLKLTIKYFDKKKVSLAVENKEKEILSIEKLDQSYKDKFILINLQKEINLEKKSIFSRYQREKLKLPINEKMLYEYLYMIYKNINASKKILLYFIENEEENISENQFLAELIYKYNIKVIENDLKLIDEGKVLNQFINNKNLIKKDEDYNTNKDILYKKYVKEIKEISVSKLLRLLTSEYHYYLENEIRDNNMIFNTDTSYLIDGNIIHKLLENIFSKHNILLIEENEISKVLDNEINKIKYYFEDKIYSKYYNFYKLNNMKYIKKEILEFIKKLKLKLKDLNIINVYTERDLSFKIKLENDKIVLVKGRVDLLIETTNKYFIIDFKTGKYRKNKENEYAKQVSIYSLMDEISDKEKVNFLSFIRHYDPLIEIINDEEITKEKISISLNNYFKNDLFSCDDKITKGEKYYLKDVILNYE